MSYFQLFPRMNYDIDGKRLTNYQTVTNIFFRTMIIKKVLENISSYYDYVVQDSDTPEILSEKLYSAPEDYWIILLANNIHNPRYDWPLTTVAFHKFIQSKYGSIETAYTTIHHYEKVIERTESTTGITTTTRLEINKSKLIDGTSDVPYDYWDALPDTQEFNVYNMGSGKTVTEVIYRDSISMYDWEDEKNNAKRLIKLIKPEYYPQIIREFQVLSGAGKPSYIRKVI